MKISTALSDAISCIQDKIDKIAVDANLHDEYNASYPAAKRASELRLRLREDIRILNRLQEIIEHKKLYIRLRPEGEQQHHYRLLGADWQIPMSDKTTDDKGETE